MDIGSLSKLIQQRRSIHPPMYSDRQISLDDINAILENANWAPTHKLTEPWRFVVIRGQKLAELSKYIGDFYLENNKGDSFSELKYKKMVSNILKSPCIIAIGIHRDLTVPEWEETAAVAMAVQNMWLSCTSLGIGSYWGTSPAALSASTFLEFDENVTCKGFFFMGYPNTNDLPEGKRTPVSNKTKWL